MRAKGKDLVEIFGFAPDDKSSAAISMWDKSMCPFTNDKCSKYNHDKSIIYGVCSVTNGKNKKEGSEVIICPKRLYANNYEILKHATDEAWPEKDIHLVVTNENINDLEKIKKDLNVFALAFGQGSKNEISIDANDNKLSMDWVIQTYTNSTDKKNEPAEFIGIEIQSIDITGNYRDNWSFYYNQKYKDQYEEVNSGHGLNWANVHKRLIPQIIRKGNVYRNCSRCVGFFFILPEPVFLKFEDILKGMPEVEKPANDVLSIMTYKIGNNVPEGYIRPIVNSRKLHYKLDDIIAAFSSSDGYTLAADELNKKLLNIQM